MPQDASTPAPPRSPLGARVVLLHAAAPPKPPEGAACNGCGLCCAAEPCPLGMLVSRRRQGACSALHWQAANGADAGRYVCGLLAEPRRWLPAALARRWIAAGAGCDSELQRA